MRVVQLPVDRVLHEVLEERRPAGHLVCLFGDALPSLRSPMLRFSVRLQSKKKVSLELNQRLNRLSHVDNDVAAQVGQVRDHVLLLCGDLSVLHQLGEVFLRDALLRLDVEENDPDLVLVGHLLVEQDRHDVLHVVLDLLALGIGAHGQVLLHFAELIHISLSRGRRGGNQ